MIGLLAIQSFLLLSEWFSWFAFNEKKGWTVLIAIATLFVSVVCMLLWFAASLILQRRFQFSLRSLLVFITVCAALCGWCAVRMEQARKQKAAVEAISKWVGAGVNYDYYWDETGARQRKAQPPAPACLRKLLGDDFFADVVVVYGRAEGFGDDDMIRVKEWTSLRSLDITGSKVTDAGLEHVKGLTNLRFLSLYGTQVTDAGLEHLKSLTKLEALNVSGPQITDAGLAHLKSLTNLKSLYANVHLTDAGLEHLKELTSLRRLCFRQGEVSDAGLKKLKQALPNCRLIVTDRRR